MVGAEDLEVPELEAVPQRGPAARVAQRRGADVLGALETLTGEVLVLEGEVLRAGLRVDGLAALVRQVNGLQRGRAGDVDDEYRRLCNLGQPYSPVRSLSLDRLGTGEGVEAGGCIAAGERLLLQLVDRVPVLGVYQDEDTGIFGELQYLQEVVVLAVQKCSFVGHEDLDRGDAPPGEVGQLGLCVVAQVGYGDVETVVYDGFVPGLLGPCVERTGEGAARFLQGEVDDHGRTAGRRGLGARGPVVRRDSAPEWHVHVSMGIDEAWHYQLARGVDGIGVLIVEVRADRDYLLVLDEHVGPVTALGRDDGPAGEKKPAHSALLPVGSGALANSRTPRAFASIVNPGDLCGRLEAANRPPCRRREMSFRTWCVEDYAGVEGKRSGRNGAMSGSTSPFRISRASSRPMSGPSVTPLCVTAS